MLSEYFQQGFKNPNMEELKRFNKSSASRTKKEKEELVFKIMQFANWEMLDYYYKHPLAMSEDVNAVKYNTIEELYKEYDLDLVKDSIENVMC